MKAELLKLQDYQPGLWKSCKTFITLYAPLFYLGRMKFRAARPVADLKTVADFYVKIFGLHIVSEFKDHEGYDGIILQSDKKEWELEFTKGPHHSPLINDPEILIVLYPATADEYDSILRKIKRENIKEIIHPNPFWQKTGICIRDPEGNYIVVSGRKG